MKKDTQGVDDDRCFKSHLTCVTARGCARLYKGSQGGRGLLSEDFLTTVHIHHFWVRVDELEVRGGSQAFFFLQ